MFNQELEKLLNVDIKLNAEFYNDIIDSELSIIYHGERLASILYKRSGLLKLSKIESVHAKKIKKIIKKIHPIEKDFFKFYKSVLKSRDLKKYSLLIDDLEQYAIYRYNTLIKVLNDKIIINTLKDILRDEADHSNDNIKITYKNKFEGYENYYLYNKYIDFLNIDYDQFKKMMWNCEFYKQLRGQK